MKESLSERVAAVREFNRGFAKRIGLLQEGLLDSPYTLTEARVLFEVGSHDDLTASALSEELGLDAGHLSRILSRLEQRGLLRKVRSESDGRQRFLHLTKKGRAAFDLIDDRANQEVGRMLSVLTEEEQAGLLRAMRRIESTLLSEGKRPRTYVLRQHEPGDMGWIVHRHGALYAREYGWNEEFEAMVAKICADFLANHDPKRERCWVAEMEGELVGSICLARTDEREVARLRVLLVEPKARGLGLGTRLVEECVKFARRSGYRKMVLWTYSVLADARRVYEKAGFKLAAEEKRRDFGQKLTGQTWELEL